MQPRGVAVDEAVVESGAGTSPRAFEAIEDVPSTEVGDVESLDPLEKSGGPTADLRHHDLLGAMIPDREFVLRRG